MSRRTFSNPGSRRRAFTLIELVTVMVVLAILSAIAIPRHFDHVERAKEVADIASIEGIESALNNAHLLNRVDNRPTSQWITDISQIAPIMQTGDLPNGIVIDLGELVDQRGYRYQLTVETINEAASLTVVAGSGPDAGSGGGGSGTGGSAGAS